MKTTDEIINELFGISIDAPNTTPMDKGECKLAMTIYLDKYKKALEKFLNTSEKTEKSEVNNT